MDGEDFEPDTDQNDTQKSDQEKDDKKHEQEKSDSNSESSSSPSSNDDTGSPRRAKISESESDSSSKSVAENNAERELVQEAEPEPEIVRIDCEMPAAKPNLGSKLYFLKLPNFLSIDTHEYDPATYEDEIDEDEIKDNEGRARMKLKVENTIRWRTAQDEDGNDYKQSNAKFIEWSDGSISLYLGSEILDITEKSMGEYSHLFIKQGSGLQGQAIFNTKLSIRPDSTESFTHKKLTLSIADRSLKTQKIKMLNNLGADPEARLGELSKEEDASMRRELKQRRIQERAQTRGPSSSYLEPDYEEDEDGAISISAIKRGAYARGSYVDESMSSEEEENYSDDSDPEFGKVKKRPERQVVEEDSDDE